MKDPLEEGVPPYHLFLNGGGSAILRGEIGGPGLTERPAGGMDDAERQGGDDEGKQNAVIQPVKVVIRHREGGKGERLVHLRVFSVCVSGQYCFSIRNPQF